MLRIRACFRALQLRALFASPLLGASGDDRGNVGGVEMQQNSADSDRLTAVEFHIAHAPIFKRLTVWGMAALCVVASVGTFALLLNEWVHNPKQIG